MNKRREWTNPGFVASRIPSMQMVAATIVAAAFTHCQSRTKLPAFDDTCDDCAEVPDASASLASVDTGVRDTSDTKNPSDDGGHTPHLEAGAPDTEPSVTQSPEPTSGDGETPYTFELPRGFPPPPVPEDNPMSAAKVELGRHLFYDKRLSENETMSCASCHRQDLAFTDGLAVSAGASGEHTARGSMMLGNVAYASTLTWANPLLLTLERQALVPMFGDAPVELGLTSSEVLQDKLRQVSVYQRLFSEAFPDVSDPFTVERVVQALASFQRTLITGNSPFDAYLYGKDSNAISDAAIRGYELFNSEKLECFHCHVGFNLSDHVTYQGKPFIDRPYHNTGLYNIDGRGAYPEPNTGVMSVTAAPEDMGRFRAPTLRNIAVTAPYMHDGSIETLSEVLDHYASGGRHIESGPHRGDGSSSPLKSSLIGGFSLTEDERASVLAFLESLTDESFLTEPRFADPWPQSAP